MAIRPHTFYLQCSICFHERDVYIYIARYYHYSYSDCCNKEALFSAEEDIAIITIVTVGHYLELRQLTSKLYQ